MGRVRSKKLVSSGVPVTGVPVTGVPVTRATASSRGGAQPGVRVRASFGYDAASSKRQLAKWNAPSLGPNSLLFQSLDILRDRAHDLVRQNPYAHNAVDRWAAEAIGTGIRPQFLHPNPDIRKKLEALWRQSNRYIDFDGQTDGCGQQALAWRTMVIAGECLARKRYEGDGPVPLQLELIEPDLLPTMGPYASEGVADGNVIKCGIEVTPFGKRAAYHLYKEHPNEAMLSPGYGLQTVRVPAEEIIHLFRPLRPKQIRGEPWFVASMVRLLQIDKYDNAELQRKDFAASLTGFVTSTMPEGQRPIESRDSTIETPTGTAPAEIEPNTLIDLQPGEEIKLAEVDDVGSQYDPFMVTQLRAIAVGAGLTYEQLTMDGSRLNHSAIRKLEQSFRRLCEQLQYSTFVAQYMDPFLREWLRVAALVGAIDVRDYRANK